MASSKGEEVRHDMGRAFHIAAEALGQPGQRRFRLLVDGESGMAVLWLEKEQLHQLAIAIKRLLAVLEEEGESGRGAPPPAVEAWEGPAFDFKVGSLGLGHDAGQDLFLVTALDEEAEEEAPATVGCWATREQLDALADQSLEVCAAGRPLCPLCGLALNPGEPHVCPRGNGHGVSA